ncbi:MAG: hypothetical protein JRJ50_05710 [Deltaproteobacteria bacterium]|nr:hypothetical protein [Deltaproteobacteria bacterium]MBW2114450.1 hypothetical protein [Deltaproteobacteria bacterium]
MSRSYHIILELLIISVVIFVGVSTFYKIVRLRLSEDNVQPPVKISTKVVENQKGPALPESRVVIDRDKRIPAVSKISHKRLEKEKVDHPDPALDKLALRGTVNGGQENALAVIEDKDIQRQGLYRIGDLIHGGVIKKILKEKVVIRFGERDDVLTIEGRSPSEAQGEYAEKESDIEGVSVTVAREDLEKAFKDVKGLISQVRIRPVILDGGSRGVQLVGIRQGSIFDKYGLKSGDIIQEINGAVIENPARLAALYDGLKSVPLDISFNEIGSGIEDILLGVDRGAGGIAKEVSDVYSKIESGDGFSLKLNRKGKRQITNYKIR